jgi:RNA polymerase sigma-70 factor (ECF subfamily)
MTAHALELEHLLPRAKAGDSPALGQLLEFYRGYLAVLARYQIGRRLRGKADASDLIQETFLEAYRDFGQFRGNTEAELVRWLRRILATNLANLVGRYCGTQRRDVRLEQALADELDQYSGAVADGLASPHSSPSQQAARRDQAALLTRALEQLPADYREVLVLRHLQELSFAEVAARMGRSLDSVKNLWARALVRLRHQLGVPS